MRFDGFEVHGHRLQLAPAVVVDEGVTKDGEEPTLGIGAGPVGFVVPAGATTLEIVSQLSIAGLLGSDGQPLGFGNLFIASDGSIAAATPIPSSLPLLATGLAALGLFAWRRKRKALSPSATRGSASDVFQAI